MTDLQFRFPGTAVLQTARLQLRQLVATDHDDLLRLGQDSQVGAHLLDAPLNTPQQAESMILWMNLVYTFGVPEGLGNWRADTVEGAFVGLFSLMPVAATSDVEIGARLLPEFWNQGYAVEGGLALCHRAFEQLALPRLVGLCDPANNAVPAVLARLGFVDDGDCLHFGKAARRFVLDKQRWTRNQANV